MHHSFRVLIPAIAALSLTSASVFAQTFNELNPVTTDGATIVSNTDNSAGEFIQMTDSSSEVFYADGDVETRVSNEDDVIIQIDTDDDGTGAFIVNDFNGGAATQQVIYSDAATTTLNSTTINLTATTTNVSNNFDVDGLTTTDGITNDGNVGTTTLSTTGLATLNSASVTNNFDVDGATTTDGITNDGNIGSTTLSTTGLATLNSASVTNNATIGGTLGVTGATTTAGITNTGNIGSTTLSTTGLATLNSASVTNNATIGGTLGVTGATTTAGITNTGNVGTTTLSTTGLATLNSVSVTNNATVGGTLGVTSTITGTGGMAISGGASTIASADTDTTLTINDNGFVLNNDSTGTGSDDSNITISDTDVVISKIDSGNAVTNSITVGDTQNANVGANNFDYGTTVNGGMLLNGDLGVNGSIFALNPNNNVGVNAGDSGLAIQGATDTVTLVADDNAITGDGRSQITMTPDTMTIEVVNQTTGQSHGLSIDQNKTVLSGGTSSTNLTLNDSGATFDNNNGGPARVTGIADGKSRYDAVNYGQLESVKGGIAAVSAMASLPALQYNKNYSVAFGSGTYDNVSAFAFGGTARINDNFILKANAGRSAGDPWVASVGVSYSW